MTYICTLETLLKKLLVDSGTILLHYSTVYILKKTKESKEEIPVMYILAHTEMTKHHSPYIYLLI